MNTLGNVVRIMLPGMEVFLSSFFWEYIGERPRRIHSHLSYELVFVALDDGMKFIINPPFYEHMSADAPREKTNSIMFSLIPEEQDRICDVFKKITEPIELDDDFGGAGRIALLKQFDAWDRFGVREQMAAELRLLFISLAQVLHNRFGGKDFTYTQTLDEERMVRIMDFFRTNMCNPSCSKKQLADSIGVGERQLSRILNEVYGKSFSRILLEMRMDNAEIMRNDGRSIFDIMRITGYSSKKNFKYAYEKFFGRTFNE